MLTLYATIPIVQQISCGVSIRKYVRDKLSVL